MNEYLKAKELLLHMLNEHQLMFNMALTHLWNVGYNNIKSVNLENVRKRAEEEEQRIKEKGNLPWATVDFQVEIVELAKEIASIASPVNLMTFIQDCMDWYTGNMNKKKLKQLLADALNMAWKDNLYAYDADQWKERVMNYLNIDEEEYDEIMN